MIKSMTAFAKAVHTQDAVTAEAVIRSYNSRHLDVAVYLPDMCQGLEEEIKKIVTRYHHRGRMKEPRKAGLRWMTPGPQPISRR